jgi:hypothetical protein
MSEEDLMRMKNWTLTFCTSAALLWSSHANADCEWTGSPAEFVFCIHEEVVALWDAMDDLSAPAGLTKGDLYEVTGTPDSTSTAACEDENDVLLHGGCTSYFNCLAETLTSQPQSAADPDEVSQWYCAANCAAGEVTAYATCISLDDD